MKTIYILPGLLAVLIPMLKGFEMAYEYLSKKDKMLHLSFNVSMLVLLVLYLIPILDLIVKLSSLKAA
jgi:hypothetical protein